MYYLQFFRSEVWHGLAQPRVSQGVHWSLIWMQSGRVTSKIIRVLLAESSPLLDVSLEPLSSLKLPTFLISVPHPPSIARASSCFHALNLSVFHLDKVPPASQLAPEPALLSVTVQTGNVMCHKHVVPFCQCDIAQINWYFHLK